LHEFLPNELNESEAEKMKVTYRIAMAAGRDAADRNMKAAGRTRWSEEDWNVAAETVARLLGDA
jgi:hypothetical protein